VQKFTQDLIFGVTKGETPLVGLLVLLSHTKEPKEVKQNLKVLKKL
jgi:hypothetical protein